MSFPADGVLVSPAVDRSPSVGLCADCSRGRRLVSAKGSEFWLCGRSEVDPRFPKYPRLPVLQCPGYERADSSRASDCSKYG